MSETKQVVVHRLSTEVFNQLESSFPLPAVSQETTAHQAGFLLGIPFVLRKLRQGFVIETS